MLVEINLIEKKKHRNLYSILIGSVLFIFLLVFVMLFLYYQTLNNQESKIQSQLKYIEHVKATKPNHMNNDETTQAVNNLKNAVKWAEETPISASILLKSITNLLPERGYIKAIDLTNDQLLLDVRFDTSRDAAYYLKALEDAKFVKGVNLDTITTEEIQNETEYLPRYIAQYTVQLNKAELKRQDQVSK